MHADIALQHAELSVDMVVEDDIGPTLNSYKMIYLADSHVTKKAAAGLAAWVAQGGILVRLEEPSTKLWLEAALSSAGTPPSSRVVLPPFGQQCLTATLSL
jgi:hypothetical protein